MSKNLLWLVLCILSFPCAAKAQTAAPPRHRAWEFSVFGGGSYLGRHEYNTPVLGQAQETSRDVVVHYADGPQLGARISENHWNRWGADLEYSFSNQPLTLSNLSPNLASLSLAHSIHRLVYDIAYYPLERSRRLRPYGFAGAGVSLFHISGSSKSSAAAAGVELEDSWQFVFSWGGGVKCLLRDQVAIGFQVADNISGVPGYGLPRSAQAAGGQYVPGLLPDGYLHNLLIQASFIYEWGER
jgi:opacity protein-like surface antigen